MNRQLISAIVLLSASATTSHARQCLDAGKVQDLIVKHAIGVMDVYFSHVQGASTHLVFKLKGGKVLSVDHEGQCILSAEVMTRKQYLQSTIEPATECDGCEEQPD
jgi:hypothetical protein